MAITPLPTPPLRSDPANFAQRGDEFLGALPAFATEANALAEEVTILAETAVSEVTILVEAAVSEVTILVEAAVSSANVTKWISGTEYVEGEVVWSPINYLAYRRKSDGSGTTDPSLDGTNWALVVGDGDVKLTATQTLTNKTLDAVVLNDGYTEEVFAVTGTTPALSPTNGSIQTWTLSGASTPTEGTWAAGQSITLLVDDGTDYAITWSTLAVVWKTDLGVAPELNTSGDTVIVLWKVGSTIYGARVGDA